MKLVAQRIALGILLLLAVSVLIFAGTQILPGDVAQAILGQSATPESLANLREQLGLNDPAYVRYFRWLGGVLTGDLGTAHVERAGHRDIDRRAAVEHAVPRLLGGDRAVPLAIILGLIAVRYRNGSVDKLISGTGARLDLVSRILHRLCARLLLRGEVADVPGHLDRL